MRLSAKFSLVRHIHNPTRKQQQWISQSLVYFHKIFLIKGWGTYQTKNNYQNIKRREKDKGKFNKEHVKIQLINPTSPNSGLRFHWTMRLQSHFNLQLYTTPPHLNKRSCSLAFDNETAIRDASVNPGFVMPPPLPVGNLYVPYSRTRLPVPLDHFSCNCADNTDNLQAWCTFCHRSYRRCARQSTTTTSAATEGRTGSGVLPRCSILESWLDTAWNIFESGSQKQQRECFKWLQ